MSNDFDYWEVGTIRRVSPSGWAYISPDGGGDADTVFIPSTICFPARSGQRVEYRRIAAKRGWEAAAVRIVE